MVDFVKKNWQFRDIISENELNRMEDGIEEGIMKAEQAQETAESHASRHASGGPDEVTPEMIGAETPEGAQVKADQAEANAKAYADAEKMPKTGAQKLNFSLDLTPLNISDGAITVTSGFHVIDTEGGAASDELDFIHGGSDGDILIIRAASTNRPITVRDNLRSGGNIYTFDRADIVLNQSPAMLPLIRHAGNWYTLNNVGVKRSGDTMTGSFVVYDGSNYRSIAVKRDHSGGEVGEIRLEVEAVAGAGVHVTRMINNEISGRLTLRGNAILFNSNTIWHAGNLPYETGTWTPRLVIGGVVPGSVTYSVQIGRYTRIGNRVIADFELQLSSKGTATGNVRIGYLPFVTASAPRSHALLTFHNVALSSNMTSISISTFGAGETEATLYQIGSDQSFTQLTTSNLKDNSGLYGQIIYTIGG